MMNILRREAQQTLASGTVRFEGHELGGPTSFFLVNAAPGRSSSLHLHPYAETWIVRSGEAQFTVGGESTRAHPGDIVLAAANVPHRFTNVGTERLELVCIHPNERIVQETLED